jgi:hypothetical protein
MGQKASLYTSTELKDGDDIPLLLAVKNSFKLSPYF